MIQATVQPPMLLRGINGIGDAASAGTVIWGLIDAASIGVSAYHGYKRNNGSVGWAIGWGILGGIFPILTPAIAFAQGIGKKK